MSYRSETYGRPLRLYENELKEASELYRRAVSKRHGRIVFIAGHPKSGRTDLLASIGHSLSKEYHRLHLLAGQFLEDRYIPKTADFSSAIGAAVGETLSFIAKLVGPVPSAVADFVGQLLQAGAALKATKGEINTTPPDWPEELKALIRSVSAERPIVYLVDDLDESQDSWLADLLQEMATEIDRDLPLLIFVTVEGSAKLGEHKKSDSRLMTAARSLIERGVADWWHLTPLSRDEVADYIGNARPGIAAHLHQVTGGYPRRVIQLWQDWQVRDVVRYSDEEDCWYWNQEKRPSLNLSE